MANRITMRDQARTELSVGSADTTQFTNDELNRTIDEVTADITRLMPQEKVLEALIDYVVTDESFTPTGTTIVTLSNKPIEWASDKVTDSPSTVTYVRNTDYTMDYASGTIVRISTGSMVSGAAHLISYNKSRIAIDLSSLTDLLAPISVEYPIGDTPQHTNQFYTWGDVIWLTTMDRGGSQRPMADKDHIRVYYHAQHTAPTDAADGTFPRFLDEIVVKGIVAYALFIKFRETVLLSNYHNKLAGDILSQINSAPIATALGLIPYSSITIDAGAELSAVDTTLGKVQTLIGNATGGKAWDALVLSAAETALGNTALDKVDTNLLNASISDTKTNHDKIITALGKITAIVDLIFKDVTPDPDTGDLQEAKDTWDNQPSTEPAELDFLVRDINNSTYIGVGAEEYLDAGDALINAINLGDRAAELNRQFAETSLSIATMYADRRKDFLLIADRRLGQMRALTDEASTHIAAIDQKINEAVIWVRVAQGFISEGQQRASVSQTIISEAQAWINAAQGYINEAQLRLSHVQAVLDINNTFIAKGRLYIEEARARIDSSIINLREGEARINMSRRTAENADRLRSDAQERYRDYMRMLESRVHQARRRSMASTQQYASPDRRSTSDSPRTLPTS